MLEEEAQSVFSCVCVYVRVCALGSGRLVIAAVRVLL